VRDLDRVRDKIEIRLEPRQVVLLGILTTAFSGGLFAAGYVVGTRFSSPSREVPDLAAIDAASRASRTEPKAAGAPVALGDVEFMFPAVLDAAGRGQRPAVAAPAPPPKSEAPPPPSVAEAPPPVRLPALEVAAPPSEAPPPKIEIKALPAPAKAAAPEPHEPPPGEAEKQTAAAKPPPPPDEVEKATAAAAAEEDAPAPKAAEPPKPAAPQYTLQVKAVQDKAEADAFMAELRRAGFEPQMILADLPGKGRWYRIRVGRFADMDEAREFQRKYKLKSRQPDAGFVTDL
jgi:septal ring-binding cell division protein DamX